MEKLIPKLRFPEFDSEWEMKKLGEVADIGRGKSKHRPRDADFLFGGKYPFIQTGDIRRADVYLSEFTQTYSDEGLKQSKLWNENTLCITIAANIAETAILKIKACFPDSVIGLIPKDNKTTVLFVKNLFDKFKIQIQSLSQGAAQDNLNQEKLYNLEFSFPTLPEQQKIASFLSAVDDKLQKLKKKKERLEQYKKGVMQKLFSQEIRFRDENGDSFADWEVKNLGEVCEFYRGSPFSKSDLSESGKIKCIHYGELFTKYGEVIYTVKSKTNKANGFLSKIGDILMPSSDVTPKGLAKASSIQLSNVLLGGDMNIIRPNEFLNSKYLSYLLNFNTNKIIEIVSGTTVKHIYNKDVMKLEFLLSSSLKEQTKIADFLSAIDAKIALCSKEINKMEVWKKGLLQKMFV